METTEKQFILVAIKGTHTQPVFGPAIAKLIQAEKTRLIKSGNWRGWKFQLRTREGYQIVKILVKKIKAK